MGGDGGKWATRSDRAKGIGREKKKGGDLFEMPIQK